MNQYPDVKLFIGGEWRKRSGQNIINPADESILGTVSHATESDLNDAVDAAERGLKLWRKMSPNQRCGILMKACEIVRRNVNEIASFMTLEQGKTIAQSRLEVLRGCDILEWDATEGRRSYGRIIPSELGMRYMVLREPIGVVAAFTPWNFPFSAPVRKVGGALASGCSVILKASEETPASAMMLAKALEEAGLPPGALNLIFGNPPDISQHLIAHPSVRLITFTGSVPVGKQLAELAGRHMKPAIMELGGHCPVIICDDADPVKAASASVLSKSRNAGQVCVAPTRFFVHESIYDKFVDEFGAQSKKIEVGDGFDPRSTMGPLANHRRLDAIESLVSDAVASGARLVAGGHRIGNRGFFYPLTVLADVPDHARAMKEEPFGPVALISSVASLDEAIDKGNSLPFGLAAYAFTESARNASLLAEGIECGNLAINHFTASFAETPFGGVKDSGYGREGGTEGLACYTTAKLVTHKFN
jgi:succinate-semialdehyde dehydrogenase/glutarate-semialdehyde dehydrogenase